MTNYEYNLEMRDLVTKRASFDSGVTKEHFIAAIEGYTARLEKMTVSDASKPITEEQKKFLEQYRDLIREYEANE